MKSTSNSNPTQLGLPNHDDGLLAIGRMNLSCEPSGADLTIDLTRHESYPAMPRNASSAY